MNDAESLQAVPLCLQSQAHGSHYLLAPVRNRQIKG